MFKLLKKIGSGKKKELNNLNEFKVDIHGEDYQIQTELNKAIKANKQRLMDLHRIKFDNEEITQKKNTYVKSIYSYLRMIENDSKHIFLLRQFHLVDFPDILKRIEEVKEIRKIQKVRPDVMVTLIDEASMMVVDSLRNAAKNLKMVKP